LDIIAFLLVTVDLYGRDRLRLYSERLRRIPHEPFSNSKYWTTREILLAQSNPGWLSAFLSRLQWVSHWRDAKRTTLNVTALCLGVGIACEMAGSMKWGQEDAVIQIFSMAVVLAGCFFVLYTVLVGLSVVANVERIFFYGLYPRSTVLRP